MQKNIILLSSGSIPWLGIKDTIELAKQAGYDGIELVPFKWTIDQMSNLLQSKKKLKNSIEIEYIKSIHQSWRLDIGHDKEYGIGFLQSMLFNLLRFFLFPKPSKSSLFIEKLTSKYKLPVVVHNISSEWSNGPSKKEFQHGIQYEIIGKKRSPKDLKSWLGKPKHSVVVDSRDDQSLAWAKNYGFSDWKDLWSWIGIKNIECIQLTLIGRRGIKNILSHKKTLVEDQLIWLHSQKWNGAVIVEVNPLSLFYIMRGQITFGLYNIQKFAKQTLIKGKKWS